MSELSRVLTPEAQPRAPEPQPNGSGREWIKTLWFGWWVAICLSVLAYTTYGQLQAQQRILTASQQLQQKVGEAAAVSAETNTQLGKVAELDTATTALAGKLQRLGQVNARVRTELAGMEATVTALQQSVAKLDGQAVASHETLAAIATESDALLRTLRHTQSTGAAVSTRLEKMVAIQESINADLAEMNRHTQGLDRFMGGN